MVPFVKGLHVYPYYLDDTLNNLRFVSCVKAKLSSIQFHELISVFDEWMWLMICISTFLIIIPLAILAERKIAIFSHWVFPIRVFLEQGNPVPDNVANVQILRWPIGLFLLTSIVLSNAYKNANVYNMITPRTPIPYEYVKELQRDNFTIFTRMTKLSTFGDPELLYFQDYREFIGKLFITISSKSFFYLAVSEVGSLLLSLSLSAINKNWKTRETVLASSKLSRSGLLHGAKLHSSLQGQINQLLQHSNTPQEILRKAQRYMTEEQEVLFQVLKKCNQVALILQEHLCQNVTKHLRRQGIHENVFMGKDEAYLSIGWKFILHRFIHPDVIQRLKSASETGLWTRWTTFEKNLYNFKINEVVVNAASMGGNIVVIFLVWICGISLSIMCFLIESISFVFSTAT